MLKLGKVIAPFDVMDEMKKEDLNQTVTYLELMTTGLKGIGVEIMS